jgi:hypothetical protein
VTAKKHQQHTTTSSNIISQPMSIISFHGSHMFPKWHGAPTVGSCWCWFRISLAFWAHATKSLLLGLKEDSDPRKTSGKVRRSSWMGDAFAESWEKHIRNFYRCTGISKKIWDWNIQWIGLRENLQETIDFPIKYGAFL